MELIAHGFQLGIRDSDRQTDRMWTGCQKVSQTDIQTDRKIDRAPGRQTE